MQKTPSQLPALAAFIFGFLLVQWDQWSKLWASEHLALGEGRPLSSFFSFLGTSVDFMGLQLSHNEGVTFGLALPQPLIFGIVVLLLSGGFWLLIREKLWRDAWLFAGIILVLSGGIGNLIDRFRLGYVIDFIQVGWWPTFNLADVWICLGVGILLVRGLFKAPAHV